MAVVTLMGQSSSALNGAIGQFIRQQALMQLSGAPDTLVDAQILLTLKDFYTFTTAWRETLGPYQINQGRDTVYLNPVDQDKQIQFVHQAWLYPFMAGNARQWLIPVNQKIFGNDVNPPSTFYMQTPDELVLYPVPNQTFGKVLFIYASMIPTTLAAKLPNIAFTHHIDGLLAGLYMRMYRMPQKPWTDKALAAQYERDYRRQRLTWRTFADQNYGPRGVQTRFPRFAGRYSQTLTSAVAG